MGGRYAPSNSPKIQNVICRDMQINTENERNVEKCREIKRNAEK